MQNPKEIPQESQQVPQNDEVNPEPQVVYEKPRRQTAQTEEHFYKDVPYDTDELPFNNGNKLRMKKDGLFGLSFPAIGLVFIIAAFAGYIILTFLGVQQTSYQRDITRLEIDLVSMREADSNLQTKVKDSETRISNALLSIESNAALISETKSEITSLNNQVSSMESNIVSKLDALSLDLTDKVDAKITEMETTIDEIVEAKEEEITSEPLEISLKSLGDVIIPVGATSVDTVYKVKLVNNMQNTKVEDIILTLYTQAQPMLLNITNPTASGGFTTWKPVYSYGGMIFQNNWGLSLGAGESKTIMLSVHAEFDPVTVPTFMQAEIELEDYD